jgi:hypothetical protein
MSAGVDETERRQRLFFNKAERKHGTLTRRFRIKT